jgi:phenylacetate-coenzyme A ligase PaaK-like adenylate-forming protein
MSLRNKLTEKVILPASDLILGQAMSQDLKFLLKSQWWSEEKLIEYQNERLRALIKHSYDNVEY